MAIIEKIKWLGHASFLVEAKEGIIYIDPWKIEGKRQEADIIFITHEHYDHFSPDDVKKLLKQDTAIVCSPATINGVKKLVKEELINEVIPGETIDVKGVKVKVLPAYNVKPERLAFHPLDKVRPRVGYLIESSEGSIYHPGDTDELPEMEGLKPDVLLIPVGGTYTMDAVEAAQAATKIAPKVAVPMHWGDIVGSRKDADEFKKRYKGNTVIMEKR